VIILAKRSTNKGLTKRMESEKSLLPAATYQFELGNSVIYLGGIHMAYKNKIGIITKKANKLHRIDYSVLFNHDQKEINCIMESVLVLVVDTESEEINNEN